jgi:hypothetical protein
VAARFQDGFNMAIKLSDLSRAINKAPCGKRDALIVADGFIRFHKDMRQWVECRKENSKDYGQCPTLNRKLGNKTG